MNLICIYCEEPITDAANIVFGEPMHLECECEFYSEWEATGIDNVVAV